MDTEVKSLRRLLDGPFPRLPPPLAALKWPDRPEKVAWHRIGDYQALPCLLMQGYLLKAKHNAWRRVKNKRTGFLGNLSRRFFVLQSPFLYYYKSHKQSSSVPNKDSAVDLRFLTVAAIEHPFGKFGFEIRSDSGTAGSNGTSVSGEEAGPLTAPHKEKGRAQSSALSAPSSPMVRRRTSAGAPGASPKKGRRAPMAAGEALVQAASDDELNTRGLGLGVSGVLQEDGMHRYKGKDRGRLFMLFAASEHERRVWVTTLKAVCDDLRTEPAGADEASGGRRGKSGQAGAVAASPGHSRSRST